MSCLGRCLACFFCDCLCCECNCVIFPSYMTDNDTVPEGYAEQQTPNHRFGTVTINNKQIPYLELSTAKSKKSQKCFIYFHGNAENIIIVDSFIMPIVEQTQMTVYAIEYPTYGAYETCCPARVSDSIKEDGVLFYDHLINNGKRYEDIYVLGRSIGSGGASYLANKKQVPRLVLISPFDTIRDVARGMVGCVGCIVKQHFNNEEELMQYTGRLLVIHGENDEVINVKHGRHLVQTYEMHNPYKNKAVTKYPMSMTHNIFDIYEDIAEPIKDFIQKFQQNNQS